MHNTSGFAVFDSFHAYIVSEYNPFAVVVVLEQHNFRRWCEVIESPKYPRTVDIRLVCSRVDITFTDSYCSGNITVYHFINCAVNFLTPLDYDTDTPVFFQNCDIILLSDLSVNSSIVGFVNCKFVKRGGSIRCRDIVYIENGKFKVNDSSIILSTGDACKELYIKIIQSFY
jgi:hypothetical protein